MSPLPILDWHSSLDEIANALQRALEHLERFEAEWAPVLRDEPVRADRPSSNESSSRLEGSVRDWEGRLTAAAELADSVEQELSDRQIEVERWHQSFSRWHEMIQQSGVRSQESGGQGTGDRGQAQAQEPTPFPFR